MSIDVNVQNNLVIVTESSEDITVNVSNARGADGVGVPTGGTTGQVLKKLSNTNYDTYWALDGGGVPYSGATGQVDLGNYDLKVQGLTIGKGNNSLVNNTALGHSTLLTATTGNYNTAVGYESLRNTTTGQYNTAVGQSSLFSNTTGGQNTALGLNALLSNTTASSNVAVGLDSLQHITTGSSNTAIGYNAGSHITGGSTPNTTATNSVFIGRDSKANADGQTNQIVIGQNAVGNGSNTATFGNTATTANYFTGSINGGSFVKSGGTSAQILAADGSVLTAGTNITISSGTISASGGVTGSGTSGQVAYWNGTSSQTGSNNLFWDAANARLGIGTNAPDYRLHNVGTSAFDAGASNDAITFLNNGYLRMGSTRFRASGNIFQFQDNSYVDKVILNMSGSLSYFNSGGNYVFGGAVDGGQRLQVQGTTLLNGNSTVQGGLYVQSAANQYLLFTSATNAAKILHLYWGGSTTYGFDIQTNTTTQQAVGNGYGVRITNLYNADYTSGAYSELSIGTPYFPTSGTGTYTNLRLGTTVNQTGGANGITRGLYVNPTLTAAADWRSIEWSNNSGWGLYGAGTAPNLLNGNLGIGGSVTPVTGYGIINLNGSNGGSLNFSLGGTRAALIYNDSSFFTINTENSTLPFRLNGNYLDFSTTINLASKMRLTNAGRLLLGTTSEGAFIFDAVGSARITGNMNMNATASAWGSNFRVIEMQGGGTVSSFTTDPSIQLLSNLYHDGSALRRITAAVGTRYLQITGEHVFEVTGSGAIGSSATMTTAMKLTNAGRLLLGTTTEGTFLLDVNGTARVSGAMTLSSATPSITLGGDLTISNTPYPSRSISIDILNSNINLLAGGFGEGMFIGGRLTSSRTATNYVQPDGLYGTGSGKISPYDSNGNVIVQAANNGNRSICLRPLQSVLIGDITTANGTVYNAILRCDSTDKGFMPPRMTTTQKNAIASPTAGLMVFDTTLVKLCVHNGTSWETITSI
jgi:hypothetical protein